MGRMTTVLWHTEDTDGTDLHGFFQHDRVYFLFFKINYKKGMIYQETTSEILKCFYTVYATLGFGFLEKVYENALMLELRKHGLTCAKQVPVTVHYQGTPVGDYYADIIVENKIIIELKAAETLVAEHELQLTNYLKATKLEVGLLLNFGKAPQVKRKIFTNDNKTLIQTV